MTDERRRGKDVGFSTYAEWVQGVPKGIRDDSLWKVKAYRFALYMGDAAWEDVQVLRGQRHLLSLADQLYRAVGSIGANIAEGYSRASGRDRAKFYEYALGSAREARDWYYKSRHILGSDIFEHRMNVLNHIIRLLITMIPQQRGGRYEIREPQAEYEVDEPIDF